MPLALLACRPDLEEACAAYVDALGACLASAYASEPTERDALLASLEGTCDDHAELRGKDAFACPTEAFEAAACESPEGYAAALEDAARCGEP